MTELVVILGVLVILMLWIAGHNIYRWRTDVLTGRYFSSDDQELVTTAGERIGSASKAAEERRKTRAFLMGWASDRAEAVTEPQGQIDAGPIDPGNIDPRDSGAGSGTAVPTQAMAPTK